MKKAKASTPATTTGAVCADCGRSFPDANTAAQCKAQGCPATLASSAPPANGGAGAPFPRNVGELVRCRFDDGKADHRITLTANAWNHTEWTDFTGEKPELKREPWNNPEPWAIVDDNKIVTPGDLL